MNTLEAINDYTTRGYNVIPLARNSKSPKTGFDLDKYFNEKYPAGDLIKQAAKEQINLGIMTGKTSNLAVIDVDEPAKTNTYLSQYPTDMIQRTPSGGAHLLYQYNEMFPDIRKIDGGDFFAGKHYIVAAPSTFNNISYEWLKFGKPTTLPPEIFVQKLQIQTGKYTRMEILDLLNYATKNGSFRDGQWNDSILYISTILAGDGWNKDSVFNFLNTFNKGTTPLPERMVRGMIERAFEYAAHDTYQKELPKTKQQVQAQALDTQLNISSYGTIMSEFNGHTTKWMVDSWMLESSVMIVAAPPERYKTWLAVDLALSVASGLPFLETYEVKKTGNVLVLQQEDFSQRYFQRFEAVEKSKLFHAKLEATLEEKDGVHIYTTPYDLSNKIFFHTDSEFTLENEQAIQKLEERIKETKAILCIIDPFYSLGSAEDHFAFIAQQIRRRIKDIRNRTGCAFLFVHHTRKSATSSDGDATARSEIFGSQFVSAVMEGSWMVGRSKGMGNTEVIVYRRFKDEVAPVATKIVFHINTREETDTPYSLDINEYAEDLLEELKEYLSQVGAKTFTELFDQFGDRFGSKTAFSRWIKGLVGNGITQENKKGRYSVEPD